MIGMAPIERIIELALWSAYLRDDQAQSVLIVAEVEGGKSALAMQYKQENNSVAMIHDATAYEIIKQYRVALEAGTVKHLIFPEFVFPMVRSKETVNTFLAFLNGLMEEGIIEIRTFATSFKLRRPIKAGVIACIARDEFQWRKYYWSSIGFLSRFLPVTYSYSENVTREILSTIYHEQKASLQHLYEFKDGKVWLPPEIASRLNPQARHIVDGMAAKGKGGSEIKKLSGMRMQKHLQRMAKAAALSKGKTTVDEDDLREIIELSHYINLEYNEL